MGARQGRGGTDSQRLGAGKLVQHVIDALGEISRF
jgi:hypothetical protein